MTGVRLQPVELTPIGGPGLDMGSLTDASVNLEQLLHWLTMAAWVSASMSVLGAALRARDARVREQTGTRGHRRRGRWNNRRRDRRDDSHTVATGDADVSILAAGIDTAVVIAQPPTTPVEWPDEVWQPIMTGLSWLLWFAIITCIAALFVCGAVFVNQRKSTGTQIVEDATLTRILICAAIIGSASGITQAVLA